MGTGEPRSIKTRELPSYRTSDSSFLWPRKPEPTHAHRTDDIDAKVEILQRSMRAGNHELARGVAASITDTVANERMLHADPGPADLPACGWRPTGDLPSPWAHWAAGWNLCQTLRLTEPIGQTRQAEPVDLLVGKPAAQVMAPGRELRVAMLALLAHL